MQVSQPNPAGSLSLEASPDLKSSPKPESRSKPKASPTQPKPPGKRGTEGTEAEASMSARGGPVRGTLLAWKCQEFLGSPRIS